MKGCWDPEFEPSVEEIMDYCTCMVILSVCFPWRACTLGGFPPIQSSMHTCTVGGGHVQVNLLKPCAAIYAYMKHVQFVNVSDINNGGVQ